jgi:hypothetical protein
MKRVVLSIAFMILLISACAPQAAATSDPSVIDELPTPISTDLTPAQRIAISKLAENLGITPDQIKLVSTEAVDWPDSCLGVSTEGIACSQIVTPGFRVILEFNGKTVEFHTNQDASVIVPATVALTWKRNGGVAGFCDSMTIFVSGEVQATSCKNVDMVEKRLSDLVSPAQIAILDEWLSKFGNLNIDMSDPAGVADRMTVNVELFGTGTEQTISSSDQQLLLTFIQDLFQKLTNP